MSQNAKSLVLIVDDEPVNLKLLRSVLLSAGHEVIAAADGITALQMAEASQPQLILLDVTMPDMDGYAVCSRLKTSESTRHIPVIFVTARDDMAAEARGFELGAADYITKPILFPVVLARVRTHLALYGQRRHLEGMFREVMEFAPDAFVLWDAQGRIVQINARTEGLFGYQRQELIGQPIQNLLPQRHRRNQLRQLERLTMGVSVQCLRKDGSEFPGDINLSPLETNLGRLSMAVVRDISERQQAQKELAESRELLRELAAQSEATREEERKHIAREIHDELGQVLTALRMDMSLLGMRFGAQDPGLVDQVQGMKGLVDRAIQGVRNVASNLRPTALDLGLSSAIEWLSCEFTRHTAIPCVFHLEDEGIDLDETRSVVLFRIAQESLTNVTRYAGATRVDVTLHRCDNELRLEVRDNGCGFDPETASLRKSFGLLGMRERALVLGGRVGITSAAGQGTVVAVSIPLSTEAATAHP